MPQPPLPIGTTLFSHEVTRVIGTGGFGVVYEAIHPILRKRVAIKEFFPLTVAQRGPDGVTIHPTDDVEFFQDLLAKFTETSAALTRLSHPNIVGVINYEQIHGTAYIMMDYIDGVSLRSWRREQGARFDEAMARSVFTPVIDALGYMHSCDMLHRDVSPDNIMMERLDEGGHRPRLIDFGALKTSLGGVADPRSAPVYHPKYSPPEQGNLSQSLTTASEVFSLSATIYAVASGEPPTSSGTRSAASATGQGDPYEPLALRLAAIGSETLARFSPDFMEGVDHGLRLPPGDRPQTMTALRDSLGWTEVVIGDPPPPEPRPNSTALIAAAAAVVGALAVGGIFVVGGVGGDDDSAADIREAVDEAQIGRAAVIAALRESLPPLADAIESLAARDEALGAPLATRLTELVTALDDAETRPEADLAELRRESAALAVAVARISEDLSRRDEIDAARLRAGDAVARLRAALETASDAAPQGAARLAEFAARVAATREALAESDDVGEFERLATSADQMIAEIEAATLRWREIGGFARRLEAVDAEAADAFADGALAAVGLAEEALGLRSELARLDVAAPERLAAFAARLDLIEAAAATIGERRSTTDAPGDQRPIDGALRLEAGRAPDNRAPAAGAPSLAPGAAYTVDAPHDSSAAFALATAPSRHMRVFVAGPLDAAVSIEIVEVDTGRRAGLASGSDASVVFWPRRGMRYVAIIANSGASAQLSLHYDVALSGRAAPGDGDALALDETYSVALEARGSLTFDLPRAPGEILLIETFDLVSTDTRLTVDGGRGDARRDDDGGLGAASLIAYSGDARHTVTLENRLTRDGLASLRVTRLSDREAALGRPLSVDVSGGATRRDATPFPLDSSVRLLARDAGWFEIDVDGLDFIEVETFELVGVDPRLRLETSIGALLEADDNRGRRLRLEGERLSDRLDVELLGQRRVFLHVETTDDPGAFSLRVTSRRLGGVMLMTSEASAPEIQLSIDVDHRVRADGPGDLFVFLPRSTVDRLLTIETVDLTGDVDTVLEALASPDGEALARDDDGGVGRASVLHVAIGPSAPSRVLRIVNVGGSGVFRLRVSDASP